MKTMVAAIDFGTSKIVTLVAENSGAQRCDIVGAGIAAYDGFLPEGWNNLTDIDKRIRESIQEAEQQSRRKIKELNVGVPGAFTKVYTTEARVQLSGPDPRVTATDVRAVFDEAAKNLGAYNGVKVHSSPAWFMVDDGKKTLEPVGMKGRELSAMVSFVIANKFFVDDVNLRLAGMGIKATGFYSAPAGEAMLYLPEEDRDRTAILIDVGYLNTEVMAVEGDALIFHRYIDIGGGNIAADLSIELDIPLKYAEDKIKHAYVFGISTPNETYEVPSSDGQSTRSFTREQVSDIILRRVDEIADEIKKAIDESGLKLGSWSNIYLTGGGLAFNRGGKDYLASKLGRPVRETPKRTVRMNSHVYSSTMGLMDMIIETIEHERAPATGFGGAVKDFFKGLLGG